MTQNQTSSKSNVTKNDQPNNDSEIQITPEAEKQITSATKTSSRTHLHEESDRPVEYGGQAGPEPTRYGDWEKKGRCTDF